MSIFDLKTNEKPMVSVFCMTYNHKDTIAQTIEGVLQQKTDFPIELIIHDDASTDSTQEIVREYVERYPDIVRAVFQTENKLGSCNIFKTYMNPIAQGEYVALCEGDDYWTDCGKLQKQFDYMTKNPDCMLCFHAVEQLDSSGNKIIYRPFKSDGEASAEQIIGRGGLFCPTVSCFLRREVMNSWPKFREMADVYDYPTQVLAAVMGRVYYMDSVMAVYRFESEGSWTAQHANEVSYAHIENETEWLETFNTYTGGKYDGAVKYHMAHMWFTEYRKSMDIDVQQKMEFYIKRLPFVQRILFKPWIICFRLFGKRTNRLWIKMKTFLLK